MSAERKIQRRAAREAARNNPAQKQGEGKGKPEKPLINNQAIQMLEAFALAQDVTKRLEQGSPCPYCLANLDAVHSLKEQLLVPSSLTVCIKCGGISRYDEELKLQAFSAEQMEALPPEHREILREYQSLIRHVRSTSTCL